MEDEATALVTEDAMKQIVNSGLRGRLRKPVEAVVFRVGSGWLGVFHRQTPRWRVPAVVQPLAGMRMKLGDAAIIVRGEVFVVPFGPRHGRPKGLEFTCDDALACYRHLVRIMSEAVSTDTEGAARQDSQPSVAQAR